MIVSYTLAFVYFLYILLKFIYWLTYYTTNMNKYSVYLILNENPRKKNLDNNQKSWPSPILALDSQVDHF